MPSIRKRLNGLMRTLSTQSGGEDGGTIVFPGSGPNTPSPDQEYPVTANDMRITYKNSASPPPEQHSFIYLYLTGRLKKGVQPEIYHGKTGVDLPLLQIEPLTREIKAAYSGPEGGLTKVPAIRKKGMANIANLDDEFYISTDTDSICGDLYINNATSSTSINSLPPSLTQHNDDGRSDSALNWESEHERASGYSTSLYEVHPFTKVHAGSPIADVYGLVCRDNNCVLALADGVNWGERAQLAARCAIRGAIEHLNHKLFPTNAKRQPKNTQDIFHELLGAFHTGHQLILQEGGLLTTLCVTVVCKLKDSRSWVVCACNVGDSLCFVYNKVTGVREVTLGSHDIHNMRDMRDAGGALGPVDGINPELQNLTCSLTVIEEDDIVFITSDGVSDNFDPVVGKFCVIKGDMEREKENLRKASAPPTIQNGTNQGNKQAHSARQVSESNVRSWISSTLPVVEAHQRHELMLLRMEDLLKNGVTVGDRGAQSARQLCTNMVNFAQQLTMAKRRILEDADLYQGEGGRGKMDQRTRRKLVRQKIAEMPGKLDHASVVAYQVGKFPIRVSHEDECAMPEVEDTDVTPKVFRKEYLPEADVVSLESPTEVSEISISESFENRIQSAETEGMVQVECVRLSISNTNGQSESNEIVDKSNVEMEIIEELMDSFDEAIKPFDLESQTVSYEDRVRMIDDSSQSSSVSSGLHDSGRLSASLTENTHMQTDLTETTAHVEIYLESGGACGEAEYNGLELCRIRKSLPDLTDWEICDTEIAMESAGGDEARVQITVPCTDWVAVQLTTKQPQVDKEIPETSLPKETCALMNTSYYQATTTTSSVLQGKQKRPQYLYNPEVINGKAPAFESELGKESGKGRITRTIERIEHSLTKKKKHKRHSPTRNTIAVDSGWFQKLRGTIGRKSEDSGGNIPSPVTSPKHNSQFARNLFRLGRSRNSNEQSESVSSGKCAGCASPVRSTLPRGVSSSKPSTSHSSLSGLPNMLSPVFFKKKRPALQSSPLLSPVVSNVSIEVNLKSESISQSQSDNNIIQKAELSVSVHEANV